MSRLTPPRSEGVVRVGTGRDMGYAEFGPPDGRSIVWLHGTPGGRRQIPQAARMAAEQLGVRIIGIDRPGIGVSTPHFYDAVVDFAEDLGTVLDRCEVERCAVVGLSGGGPYALSTGHALPERVAAIGILGGVAPTRGRDAAAGGPVSLGLRFEPLLGLIREPMAHLLHRVVGMLRPFASPAFDLYARLVPEGDRIVLGDPEIKEMFLDDLLKGSLQQMRAPVYDMLLFFRHWGFPLSSIRAPVHWWHGDADNLVPLEHARHVSARLQRCTLVVRPGESHLGGMGAAREVVETVLSLWEEPVSAIAVPAGS